MFPKQKSSSCVNHQSNNQNFNIFGNVSFKLLVDVHNYYAVSLNKYFVLSWKLSTSSVCLLSLCDICGCPVLSLCCNFSILELFFPVCPLGQYHSGYEC